MVTPEQVEALSQVSGPKLQLMRERISECSSAIVAFSGGVDSTFVLKIAADVLGSRAVAVTAVSPSLSTDEEIETKRLASFLQVRHEIVHSNELADPRYAENSPSR